MDFSRYDGWIATRTNNIITNKDIVIGNRVLYCNPEKIEVLITDIDYSKGIVTYENDNKHSWWDYFMDANWRVLKKIE